MTIVLYVTLLSDDMRDSFTCQLKTYFEMKIAKQGVWKSWNGKNKKVKSLLKKL